MSEQTEAEGYNKFWCHFFGEVYQERLREVYEAGRSL